MTYDATGVKVEQSATQVGLSWNLALGGRVSRSVNGLPDDYVQGSYATRFNNPTVASQADHFINNYAAYMDPMFNSISDAQDYYHFLYDLNFNKKDAEMDYFNISAPGMNETLIFHYSTSTGFEVRAMNNPRLDISFQTTPGVNSAYISSWTITNEDGTKYYFEDVEITHRQNLGADTNPNELMGDANTFYVSSWQLTKIESKNGKDVFTFTYEDEGYVHQSAYASSSGSATTDIEDNQTYYLPPANGNYSNITTSIKQRYLSQVSHNGRKVIEPIYGTRKDVTSTDTNYRLKAIEVLDWELDPIMTFGFNNNDYFNSDGLTPNNIFSNGKLYHDIRLKLNSITVKGSDNQVYKTWSFEYDRPNDLPSRNSFGQDYFGYYNGANSNTSLFMKYESSGLTFDGANREMDTNYGKIGMLKKITYPTGGHTVFNYESHDEYRTTVSEGTETVLSNSIGPSHPTTPGLYTDGNGQLCDDAYLADDPKIVIKAFTVLEDNVYSLNLTSTSNNVQFFLVKPVVSAQYTNYCDFYNGPPQNNVINPLITSGTHNVSLQKGKYTTLLLLGKDGLTGVHGTAQVNISRTYTQSTFSNVDVGGMRIASINDYSKDGALAMSKKYSYEDDQDRSTGHVNYRPVLFDTRTNHTAEDSKEQLIRFGTYAKGSEPYVVYNKVVEMRTDGSGNALGATEHSFFSGQKGMVPYQESPFENWYFPSLKVGSPAVRKTTDGDGKTLEVEQYNFYETLNRPFDAKSLIAYVEEDHHQKMVFLKEHNVGQSNYFVSTEYLPANLCSPTFNGDECLPSDVYLNPQNYGYHSFMDAKYGPYLGRVAKNTGNYGGPNFHKKEAFFYDASGNALPSVTTEETTLYDHAESSPKYLPRKKTVTDSYGDVVETTLYYPHDQVVTGSTDLLAKNNLVEVVKSTTVRNPGTSGALEPERVERSYGLFGDAVLPTEIGVAKGGVTLENRAVFDFYNDGNIRQSKKADGPNTYYVWGYSKEHPIAKI
ncbi:MAG: hypothetical protein AB3N16_11525, partial [Flavobacteriaceae bacterium]